MKVLWVGDAVVSTGFSKCTHSVCDELHSRSHEVHILGLNYWGDPHAYPYKIYPCYHPLEHGHDSMGQDRFPRLLHQIQPDIAVLLNDPWNVQGYFDSIQNYITHTSSYGEYTGVPNIPIVSWLAVDAMNVKSQSCNALSHVVVWTEFAKTEIIKGGYVGNVSIVPLGVDTATFNPKPKLESRKKLGIPEKINLDSAYIVGSVGRNQLRKRLDLTIEYFAQWYHTYQPENAYLYLHTAPTGENGADIEALAKFHNISGRVILSQPSIGKGDPESFMPYTYSAFDCYISTSQAEGFCLPALEAMACGVPCIVPDWGGFDWVGDVALKIQCSSTALTAPFGSSLYTVGGIPDRERFITALDIVYHSRGEDFTLQNRGLQKATSMSWSRTANDFSDLIEKIAEKVVASKD